MKVTVDDIEDHRCLYLVQVKQTKTKKDRSFTITGPFYGIVKKYFDLRPLRIETVRFFLNYQKGRCVNQVIGKQKLTGMPRRIADFLNLADSHDYKGKLMGDKQIVIYTAMSFVFDFRSFVSSHLSLDICKHRCEH